MIGKKIYRTTTATELHVVIFLLIILCIQRWNDFWRDSDIKSISLLSLSCFFWLRYFVFPGCWPGQMMKVNVLWMNYLSGNIQPSFGNSSNLFLPAPKSILISGLNVALSFGAERAVNSKAWFSDLSGLVSESLKSWDWFLNSNLYVPTDFTSVEREYNFPDSFFFCFHSGERLASLFFQIAAILFSITFTPRK